MATLEGTALTKAAALVKLLEALGHELRLPRSRSLGDGLHELRDVGTGVRLFYVLLADSHAALLDGMTTKRDDIPDAMMKRLRIARHRVRRVQNTEERQVSLPLTNSTVAAIDQRAKDDPAFAAAVEAELQAMHIEQELIALRNASGMSQRQLAAKLGVKQPVIAKLEAGKSRNIGLQTLVRVVTAMNGRIEVSITSAERRGPTRRKPSVVTRHTATRGR
jgi:predicted XRE-type DNA-binding protein